MNRREFLRTSARASIALGGIAALQGCVTEQKTSKHLVAPKGFERAGSPRFKLSMCAYSWRDALKVHKMDMFQFIDYCADHGCDGAELTSYYFPKDMDEAWMARFKRHMHMRRISASGTSVGNDFTVADDKMPEQIKLAKKWIDNAEFFGAPYVRVFAGMSKQSDPQVATQRCIAALKECCEYSGKKGILLGLENHHGIVAEPEQIIHIVQSVDSPWLGINCDTANFQTVNPYASLEQIAPYAINVHFKGEIHPKGREKEKVPADLRRLMNILRDANYQGYLALEYESAENPATGIPKLLKRMRELM
jgi:sugar phosphate isomerase/epimerase